MVSNYVNPYRFLGGEQAEFIRLVCCAETLPATDSVGK